MMEGLKASFILTRPEMLFLLNSAAGTTPSGPMEHLLSKCFSSATVSEETVGGLADKGLITKTPDKVSLEPVIGLLARSAMTAGKLWIVNEGAEDKMMILRSDEMYLYIKRYPLIADSWRIAPYRTASGLHDEFGGIAVRNVRIIGQQGEEAFIESPNDFAWLEV